MASAATTSGGWAAPSPYLGPDANQISGSAPIAADGNLIQAPANDIGAQLGQALSAYHTHQSANPQPVNNQGYGAAAANQNNLDLGAAMQASAPAPQASYAAPGQSKLGIAIQQNPSTTQTASTILHGGSSLGTGAVAAANPVPTLNGPAQPAYIQYFDPNAKSDVWAKYDAATGQYVQVDSSFLNYGKTYGNGVQTANLYKGQGANGQAIYGDPNQLYLADGTTTKDYKNFDSQGTTFNLGAYNTQLAATAAASKAQLAGLAGGSNAARTAIGSTNTAPAPTVNNNQDFIDQLNAQMGNINSSAGVQAADATSQNTQNTLNSQLSTSGYQSGDLGAAARYGAGAAVTAEGQGALSHQQAAANAFDADFAQLGQAANQQLGLADAQTQQQANQDVQAIQDELTSLQSQLGQLDATTANQVNQHIAQLQDQISAYRNSVAAYQGTTQSNAAEFKAILSGVSQLASLAALV